MVGPRPSSDTEEPERAEGLRAGSDPAAFGSGSLAQLDQRRDLLKGHPEPIRGMEEEIPQPGRAQRGHLCGQLIDLGRDLRRLGPNARSRRTLAARFLFALRQRSSSAARAHFRHRIGGRPFRDVRGCRWEHRTQVK